MKFFKFSKNIFVSLFKKIEKDEILLNAQGLTFNTILTLVPILGLIFCIGKIIIPEEKLTEEIFKSMIKYFTPEVTQKITEVILGLIKKLETFPLGKFSIIAYFIMGLGLLFQIEGILNKIFESTKRRKFFQRITFFWICITTIPFLFIIPVSFHSYVGRFFNISLFFLITLLFFLMYVYFPAKEVHKKEALIGAIFSTFIWYLSSYLFSIYVKYAVSYSKIYGSLSAIPFFLLWIFINWIVFLLGAELVVFLEQKGWRELSPNISYPLVKLYILYLLAKRFVEEKPLNISALSEYLKISPLFLENILESLENDGILAVRENEIFFIKPLEKIKLINIVGINDLKKLPKISETEDFTKKIFGLVDNFSQITLKDLIS